MALNLIKGEEMNAISQEVLVGRVKEIYEEISKLESLKPSMSVNTLLTQLVRLCTLPFSVDVDVRLLGKDVQEMRRHLIELCGEAEGYLECHYANVLGKLSRSLSASSLSIFPYYNNYRKLAALEYTMLCKAVTNISNSVKRVAFVGSGPLPLTSIVLAMHHLRTASFDNYDIDVNANALAEKLLHSHNDLSLSQRMAFITCDILHVSAETLGCYDVVFLAALVGLGREEKIKIVKYIGRHMKSKSVLVIRSAHGARAFLYPIVEEEDVATHSPLQIISVIHPTNEIINSILLARKP